VNLQLAARIRVAYKILTIVAAMCEHTILGWTELEDELEAWRASETCATFWWRDDDATRPGPKLDRLIETAAGAPVALAVIPAQATDDLFYWVHRQTGISVLQHGYTHISHAPAGAKKSEFCDDRPLSEMLAEICSGRALLNSLFGNHFLPVFVPPWNRHSITLTGSLQAQGFLGLSASGPRRRDRAIPIQNCHADPIAWRGNRGFVGESVILGQIIGHLSARRTGQVDAMEATGLLTHHSDHDGAGWHFLSDFVRVISEHPAASWISTEMAFSSTRQ
jgi:hypothetical protein